MFFLIAWKLAMFHEVLNVQYGITLFYFHGFLVAMNYMWK